MASHEETPKPITLPVPASLDAPLALPDLPNMGDAEYEQWASTHLNTSEGDDTARAYVLGANAVRYRARQLGGQDAEVIMGPWPDSPTKKKR